MRDLTFGEPLRLLLLVAVAAIVVGYVLVQRRRKAYAVRFADVELLASVAPKRPGWRRHVPAGLLVAALAFMTLAFAKPAAAVEVPGDPATVVVAIDVSRSMEATDVSPSRLTAAQEAAVAFVEALPADFAVGLVSFSGSASVRVAPTDDHAAVVAAIDQLELEQGTAIGEGVAASVAAAARVQVADGEEPAPARVVLLSDGTNTEGRSVASAARLATEAGVEVSTIAYGTDGGSVTVRGQEVAVPVDVRALESLAESTGGQAYTAASSDELATAYKDIGAAVGTTTERREVSAAFAGLALLAALGAAAGSLAWSPRLP